MLRDIDVAVLRDRLHDPGECFDGWDVTVDQLERVPVGATDAHLETDRAEVGIGDDPAHFEPSDLAGHDTVLDDRRRAGLDDQFVEPQVLGGSSHGWGDRFGDGREQQPTLGVPHGYRDRELSGASGERPGSRLGDDVELIGVVTDRPGQGATESPFRVGFKEHPRRPTDRQCRTRGERLRVGVDRPAQMVTDERPQLDADQPAMALARRLAHTANVPAGTGPTRSGCVAEVTGHPARVDRTDTLSTRHGGRRVRRALLDGRDILTPAPRRITGGDGHAHPGDDRDVFAGQPSVG